jgi:sigma-B regulation protein RsbU (phosphoserine phosphatase)
MDHTLPVRGVSEANCALEDDSSRRVSRVIFGYGARIAQEQDTEALLQLNADMARDLVGADRCSIWLVDTAASQLYTTVAHGVGEIRVDFGHGLVGACVSTAQAVVANETSNDERFLSGIDAASGYVTKSVLVVPLCSAGGKVIGAFQALNKPGGFSESDVALLGFAGSYSAAAIETQKLRKEVETARLLRRELEIAREVQMALLPHHPPNLEGFECAAYFRPATLVGGDYYDFIALPDGTLAFTLGDVAGKGVPAAVLMASIQASLRIRLRDATDSLGALAADLNNSIYALSASRYSTLFCGVVDRTCLRLRYINAGQCSPLLLRNSQSGATIERLTIGGTPVGLLPDAVYEEGTVSLQRDDVLVCFSDGVSEAENSAHEFWRESELESILLGAGGEGVQHLTDRLVREADSFANGAQQSDDMTVVAIRVL